MVLALFLIVLAIPLHELGHAIYMKKYGIPIAVFSFGLPFPVNLQIKCKRFLGNTVFQITPLLIGAYVKTRNERDIEKLTYAKQADIFGAGPLANFLFAASLIWAVLLYHMVVLVSGNYAPPTAKNAELNYNAVLGLGLMLILPIALFFGRKLFSRYLMPFVGLTMLGAMVWSIINKPLTATSGPIGITKMISENSSDFQSAIIISAIISLSIGLFNTLPIMPLDCGHACKVLLEKRFGKKIGLYYSYTSAPITIGIIALALFSDIKNLF